MTGDQDFILKLLALLMPFLSLLATGVIAWLQVRARAERKEILTAQEKIATSIDGMQDKLIAATEKASFQEGQTSERLNPETKG